MFDRWVFLAGDSKELKKVPGEKVDAYDRSVRLFLLLLYFQGQAFPGRCEGHVRPWEWVSETSDCLWLLCV